MRKHHPAFRLGNADLIRKHLEFLPVKRPTARRIDQPEHVIAFRLKNYAGRDDWRDIIVILNASREAQDLAIPEGNYTVVCRDGLIDEQGLGTIVGSKLTVSPQSALILHN